MERGLCGLDRQPVHHLDRRRDDPRGDHRRHRLATRLEGAEGGEHRRDDLGHALDAERHLHGDPQRPLGSDEHPEQVGAVLIEALPAELDELPVGKHDLRARDVVDREAVLEAVRPAGVLGDVPADRADLLARRVGCVEEAVRRDRAGDVEVRDARLDDDAPALDVDLDDPVHPRERDHHPVGDGEASARRAPSRHLGPRTGRPPRRRSGRPPAPRRRCRGGRPPRGSPASRSARRSRTSPAPRAPSARAPLRRPGADRRGTPRAEPSSECIPPSIIDHPGTAVRVYA